MDIIFSDALFRCVQGEKWKRKKFPRAESRANGAERNNRHSQGVRMVSSQCSTSWKGKLVKFVLLDFRITVDQWILRASHSHPSEYECFLWLSCSCSNIVCCVLWEQITWHFRSEVSGSRGPISGTNKRTNLRSWILSLMACSSRILEFLYWG